MQNCILHLGTSLLLYYGFPTIWDLFPCVYLCVYIQEIAYHQDIELFFFFILAKIHVSERYDLGERDV